MQHGGDLLVGPFEERAVTAAGDVVHQDVDGPERGFGLGDDRRGIGGRIREVGLDAVPPRRPSDWICATVSAVDPNCGIPGFGRDTTATSAPSAASRTAIARPMPRLAPVTSAT